MRSCRAFDSKDKINAGKDTSHFFARWRCAGIYKPINDFCQAGISVPIIGFGASLTKGAIENAEKVGVLGALGGGLIRTAIGVGTAVVMSYLVTLIFSPKSK